MRGGLDLGLAQGTNLKFYTRVAKGIKLKVKKFWGLIPTFVEITGKKLVGGGGFFPSSILNRVNPNLVSWMGFLGVLFEVWEGKINKKLKVWYVSKHKYVVSENMPVSTKILLILLMSAFCSKKSAFFGKISTFTQSSGVRAVLEIF